MLVLAIATGALTASTAAAEATAAAPAAYTWPTAPTAPTAATATTAPTAPTTSTAAERVAQLQALQQLTVQAAAEAELLADQARRLRAALAQAQQAASDLQSAEPASGSCAPPLQAAGEALRLRLAEAEAAQRASRAAVAAVARSSAARLSAPGQSADRAFAARSASEAALQRAATDWHAALDTCHAQSDVAAAATLRSNTAELALRRETATLPERSRRVRALWLDAKAGGQAAADRGSLSATAVAGLGSTFQDAAIEALARTTGPRQPAQAASDSAALRDTERSALQLHFVAEARARTADASAMAETLAAGCGPAPRDAAALQPGSAGAAGSAARSDADAAAPAGCALLSARRAERAARAAALSQVLQGGIAALSQSALQQQTQEAAVRAATSAARAELASQSAPVEAAAAAAASIALQARSAALQLQAQVEPALRLALRQAELSAPVRPPAVPARPGGEGTGPTPAPVIGPPPAAAPGLPVLAGHAWAFIAALNGERQGFGAYTYVLLRSASDLKQPAVRRRYAKVLDVVQRERRGATVASSEAPFINLFCIPGQEGGGTALVPAQGYDDDLSLQLLFRAQSGLLTRPEMKRRLRDSAGPFLLTLPLRIGDARSDTPLLFADLSAYPDDAIADLVNQYKGTLLVDFPAQQAAWKPPVPQRVALVMIGLASDVGGLVLSVMPAALAGGR